MQKQKGFTWGHITSQWADQNRNLGILAPEFMCLMATFDYQ